MRVRIVVVLVPIAAVLFAACSPDAAEPTTTSTSAITTSTTTAASTSGATSTTSTTTAASTTAATSTTSTSTTSTTTTSRTSSTTTTAAVAESPDPSNAVVEPISAERLSSHHVSNYESAFRWFEVRRSGWTPHTPEELLAALDPTFGDGENLQLQLFEDVTVDSADLEVTVWFDPGLLGKRIAGNLSDEANDVRYWFNSILRPDGSEGIYAVETSTWMRDEGFDTWPVYGIGACRELRAAPSGMTPEQYVSTLPAVMPSSATEYPPMSGMAYPYDEHSKLIYELAACDEASIDGLAVANILAFADVRQHGLEYAQYDIRYAATIEDCDVLAEEIALFDEVSIEGNAGVGYAIALEAFRERQVELGCPNT